MRRAIVLMNMGGPNNLDEVKLFLTNMFNDKYIITAPKPIRAMIAFLITTLREKEAKNNYAQLGGKSPIIYYTKKVVKGLEAMSDADIFYVMRYTPPFADGVMQNLLDYDEVYALPMYPHYSSTTTQSSIEDFLASAERFGVQHIKFVEHYYDDRLYNKAIVERIKEALDGDEASEFELIFSAHGLTQRTIDKGDPYQKHILANVEVAKAMLQEEGIAFKHIDVAYQSRIGPMAWLKPYMSDKLRNTESKKVLIYPISFTVDNSETEFELDIEYKEIADEVGIEDYRVAKAPNNHPLFLQALKEMYERLKNN